MEEKETSTTTNLKEKPVKIGKDYKPRTYTLEEFKAVFKNGRND